MRLWRWSNNWKSRIAWDAGLAWFRLRYNDADGLLRGLRLLSSTRTCGRVALYYAPDEMISRLYLGIPAPHAALLRRMAADFAFTIAEAPHLQLPPAAPMAPAPELVWESAFLAHVVDGHLFLAQQDEGAEKGSYLPTALNVEEATAQWRLPGRPPAGLSLQPSWNGHRKPPAAKTRTDTGRPWPIGRSRDGVPLYAGGQMNLYGDADAVAGWLAHLLEQLLREEPAGLVVIDGGGDLVPRLKRKPTVTRQLGRGLTYVDVDGAVVAGGFNPLASVPGEREAATLRRWQRWFGGMGVHQEGLQLLARAPAEGVADMVTLQRWLQRPAQQYFPAAVASLAAAIQGLLSEPLLREWLSWPTNIFGRLPEGALLFACRGVGWGRQQLLVAAALAALQVAEVRLVVHGFPWSAWAMAGADLARVPRLLIGNGPLLETGTVVLMRAGPQAAGKLARRFLGGDALYEENLQLLQPGAALLVDEEQSTPLCWYF